MLQFVIEPCFVQAQSSVVAFACYFVRILRCHRPSIHNIGSVEPARMACAHSYLYPPEAGNSLPQILRAATLASRSTQPANPSLIALAPISNPFGPHKKLISSSTRKPRKIKDTKPYSNYRTRSGPTSTSSRQHSALRSATPGRLGKG